MSEGVQQFGNISLGSRSGTVTATVVLTQMTVSGRKIGTACILCLQSQGQLKITSAGFFWKKTGGGSGKTVELPLKGNS